METKIAITTFDNPFNPFTQFNDWFLYDIEKGYNTTDRLARFALTSDQLSDSENDAEIERAIDEMIKYDDEGIYKKVYRNDYKE